MLGVVSSMMNPPELTSSKCIQRIFRRPNFKDDQQASKPVKKRWYSLLIFLALKDDSCHTRTGCFSDSGGILAFQWQTFKLSSNDKNLYESGLLSFDGIQQAYTNKDPKLAEYIVKLAKLDPAPKSWNDKDQEHYDARSVKAKETVARLAKLKTAHYRSRELSSRIQNWPTRWDFFDYASTGPYPSRTVLRHALADIHREHWVAVEEIDDDLLPDRFKLNRIIEQLWTENSAFSRSVLLDLAFAVPFRWGVWQSIKKIFKQSIEKQDWEVFAALAARIDVEAV